MDWSVVFNEQSLTLFGQGAITTAWLLVASIAVGGVLAIAFALALTSQWVVLRTVVGAYTFVIRGTPLLIQIYLIYYGLGQLEWIQERWDTVWPWTYFKDAVFCALLAFSLNTAGYTAEMLAGSIRETAAGEIEAAQAYGMSSFQLMRRIVLPSAMRRTLPAYSNEVVMMLQSTSLASAIPGLLDVTAVAGRINSEYYRPFEAYLFAGAMYLAATFALVAVFKRAEKHFLAFLSPRSH
jgi:arginine/ornithine transport system permease protein